MTLHPLQRIHQEPVTIKRALLSVYDKTGITELAGKLHEAGVELISTGGTAKTLRSAGLPVTDVSDVTGDHEFLDGRVKTLHPAVHGAILARLEYAPDLASLLERNIQPIGLVVANLYPFEDVTKELEQTTVNGAAGETGAAHVSGTARESSTDNESSTGNKSSASHESTSAHESENLAKATEFIDIGGPAMIRAAAKNMGHVCVLTSPDQYSRFLETWSTMGNVPFDLRKKLAASAFQCVSEYDRVIAFYLNQGSIAIPRHDESPHSSPGERATSNATNSDAIALDVSSGACVITSPRSLTLRYGENPHQEAVVHSSAQSMIRVLHGKPLSYNNYLDMDAGMRILQDFRSERPTVAILKHTVPCGLAEGETAVEAWRKAFETDPVSPFGGVICSTHTVTASMAEEIDTIFSEIVIAPSFDPDALDLLKQKKNRRLIQFDPSVSRTGPDVRSFFDGILEQKQDRRVLNPDELKMATSRHPTTSEMADLLFAWKAVRYVKSNAILFCKNRQILAIGGGQTSRIDSFDVAIRKAARIGVPLEDSVVASDAFFPFPDAIEAMQEAGAAAVIQPGGSVRDDLVTEAANKANIAMVLTGFRVFRH